MAAAALREIDKNLSVSSYRLQQLLGYHHPDALDQDGLEADISEIRRHIQEMQETRKKMILDYASRGLLTEPDLQHLQDEALTFMQKDLAARQAVKDLYMRELANIDSQPFDPAKNDYHSPHSQLMRKVADYDADTFQATADMFRLRTDWALSK